LYVMIDGKLACPGADPQYERYAIEV